MWAAALPVVLELHAAWNRLPDKADEVVNLLLRNVLESDQVFREGEAAVTSGFNTRLLDLKQMENDLRNKDRMKILNTVKTVFGKAFP